MKPVDTSPNQTRVAPNIVLPDAALSFTFARSSGPGGQNVNKLATKAQLTVTLDDLKNLGHMHPAAIARLAQFAPHYLANDRLIITSQNSRSQLANRRDCLEKLRAVLTHAVAKPRPRIPTRPTHGSRRRRLESKRQRAQKIDLRRPPSPNHD